MQTLNWANWQGKHSLRESICAANKKCQTIGNTRTRTFYHTISWWTFHVMKVVQTLKAMGGMITDLPLDLLKYIMILMVKSPDGAADLVKAISVCTVFAKIAEDADVLKAVCFDNVSVTNRYGLFQQANGLLCRCAQAGHEAAQCMLTKIILVTSSHLLAKIKETERIKAFSKSCDPEFKACCHRILKDNALAAPFMAHFLPGQECSTTTSGQTLPHWEFVRKFLCQCNSRDLSEMQPYLNCYIDYFIERGSSGNLTLHHFINKMCNVGYGVRASDEVNMEQIRTRFRERMETLQESKRESQSLIPKKEKLDAILEATLREDDDDLDAIEAYSEEEFLGMNFTATTFHNMSAYMGGIGRDCSNAVMLFEECRINVLVCFDHVFL